MRRTLVSLITAWIGILLVAVATCGSISNGAEPAFWPQFRGPTYDGKSTATNVPVRWGPTENIKWKAQLPAPGNSSPIVLGDRVFATCAEEAGQRRTLYCFARADGRLLWSRTVTYQQVNPTHQTNPYCASTPAAANGRVIVWHGSAGVFCYDLEGKQLWSQDLGEFRHIWGYGSSPILYKDRVILSCGPGERTFVIALQISDGQTLWQTDEPGGNSGEVDPNGDAPGGYIGTWATPVVAQVDGQDQIICSMPTRVNAYNPQTGDILWYCEGLANQPRGDLAYASAIVDDGVGVAMGGFNGPAIGFRVGGRGNITASNRLWRNTGPNPQRIGTGVMVGDYIYLANAGASTLECIEAATGKQRWQTRIRGNVWGSIVMAENRLYVTDQNGTTIVFAPTPDRYEEIAVNPLDEPSNSTPALADGEIFIRTFGNVYCIAPTLDKQIQTFEVR